MSLRFLRPPYRDGVLIGIVVAAFFFQRVFGIDSVFLGAAAFLAVLPTIADAGRSILRKSLTIDVFNTFAIAVSFATWEISSAAFIALMLSSARLLEWYTESRTKHAVEELLKLKPQTATRETQRGSEDIPVDRVRRGDILIVQAGTRVPVDGIVAFGDSYVNEAHVTGESRPEKKQIGDVLLSGTLVESGVLKMKATRVGKDSTIERMATLMREAGEHKSRTEKMADRFAGMFLPAVLILGTLTYVITRNVSMTAALFLIACADDMSVAIPLAITASLGAAAKRGVLIKGGEWLDVIRRLDVLILDKTGTLTYGSLAIERADIVPGISTERFWSAVGIAEKYSEHPIGKLAYRTAAQHVQTLPDPDDLRIYKGSGVTATHGSRAIAIGTDLLFRQLHIPVTLDRRASAEKKTSSHRSHSAFFVAENGVFLGSVCVADIPRKEAGSSLKRLRDLGIKRIAIFTGDDAATAKNVAKTLHVTDVRAEMTPEKKLHEIERLITLGATVGMVGDGINDAPALARADVGIAMGGQGTAVAAEAADIVILNDNLSRLPEVIQLGQRTMSVIRVDVGIWIVSNLVGFALVFTGIAGPAVAAFYNFITDFFPLINSARLFAHHEQVKK